ncbi:hypothetical protein JW960_13135 [candidate division KSB1 bacterium]|nr:hypothetical protein [candidate division KSB1 bacterium]
MQTELLSVVEKYKEHLLELNSDLISNLIAGDLHNFENKLYELCTDLYNQIALIFISNVSQSEELILKS